MDFVDFLYRIKQAIGFKRDKDVADFLGMDLKAFSARKTRNSIPEEKVRLAFAQHPHIKVDVDYILTGISSKVDLSTKKDVPISNQLTVEEQELLSLFRQASDMGRAVILSAARGAEKKAAPAVGQVA